MKEKRKAIEIIARSRIKSERARDHTSIEGTNGLP
jgi:hypothetical protein